MLAPALQATLRSCKQHKGRNQRPVGAFKLAHRGYGYEWHAAFGSMIHLT